MISAWIPAPPDESDPAIINNSVVKKSIKRAEKLMNSHGRILVRPSGTESKIRVMGESENRKLLEKCLSIILTKLKWSLILKY